MLYACIQGVVAENWLMNFLASSDVLISARGSITGIQPAVLPLNLLWKVEQLYFRNGSENSSR
jgi:hypothetical protein